MFSKLFNIILILAIFCVSERLVICAAHYTLTYPHVEVVGRIPNLEPYDEHKHLVHEDCGGVLTSAPGKIELDLISFRFGKCTWELHAPEEQHVYIDLVQLTYTSLIVRKHAPYNITVDAFDGDKSSQKLLHKFIRGGNNYVTSDERKLTIKVEVQNQMKYYWNQNLTIIYHFINHQDYLKLIED